jgi:hypothetical protein
MRPLSLAILGLIAATALAADEYRRAQDAGLRYKVPARWERVPAPSNMRAAQYRVGDAEVILFFFGEGGGGDVNANIDRWASQFTQPDGRPSREAAVVAKRTVGDAKVTTVDLSGTYAPTPMAPGAKASVRPDTRMLAAVIEGKGGPWFLRVVGPTATMGTVEPEFEQVVLSVDPHQ